MGPHTMSSLLLLSGGLDSALCLVSEPDIELAIGFDYGQPHIIELTRASDLAAGAGVPFRVVKIPEMPLVNDVVFAGRNAVLLSIAASIAICEGLDTIVIGCNKSDNFRFSDCREDFLSAMGQALSVYGIKVHAPLLGMSKSDVIAVAKVIGLTTEVTWSCYTPVNETPCGTCLACVTSRESSV